MSEKTSGLELMEPASPDLLIPEYGLWPWFAVAAAIIAIVVLAAWLFLRKKKPAIDLLTLRNAAFAEAIAGLAGTTTASTREAAVQCSLILRKYLSAAANDTALFETHEEFISRHDALQDDELVGFLSGEFRDLLGFDWIGVVFIDDARANAHVETGWLDGRPQSSDRRLYCLQGTLLESALADAAPLHVADAVARVRENPAYEFLGHLVALGMRDAIFLPLTAQTQTPVPAVVVFATRRPEGFDGARRRLLGNIAQLLTQAFGRTARFAEQGRLAAIGEFASGIAHELRTPLTTVSMALESLAGLALDERAQRRIALGAGEAERMRRLLDDMLLYAKPLSLNLQAVDVVSTLADFVAGYDDGERRHPLRLASTPTAAYILADQDRLRQILVNLTDNACQAAPEGTPVTWHIEEQRPEQRILLRVHNGGEPIPAHLLARLTEPFFSTKTNGTGLGLAIVRRLVDQHGGQMRLASDPQTGTEVRLSFPALTPD